MKKIIIIPLFIFLILTACKNKEISQDNLNTGNIIHSLIYGAEKADSLCNYTLVVSLMDSAELIVKALGNDSLLFQNSLPKILNLRGSALGVLGKNIDAWHDFQRSLEISDKRTEFKQEIFNALRGLGVIFYYYPPGFQKAFYYINKASKYTSNRFDSAQIIYFKCETYIFADNSDSAMLYLDSLVQRFYGGKMCHQNIIKEDIKDFRFFIMEPFLCEDMAKIQAKINEEDINKFIILKKSFPDSLIIDTNIIKAFKKSIDLTLKVGDIYQLSFDYFHKGNYLVNQIKKYKIDTAKYYLSKAYSCLKKSDSLADIIKAMRIKARVLDALSNYYNEKKDGDSAYLCLFKADSLNKILNDNTLYLLQKEYDDKQLAEEKDSDSNSRTLIIIFAALLFVAVIIIISTWKSRRTIRRESEKLQILYDKKVEAYEISVEAYKKSQLLLIEADKKKAELEAIDNLIAWFAHEIKTQLEIAVTGLTTNKKFMEKFEGEYSKILNTSDFYKLQRINENSKIVLDNILHTNRIIKELRVISLKQIESDLRTINIKEFLLHLFNKLKYQRENKTIELLLIGDVDIEITTYPIALEQVFSNLMLNSIMHGFLDRKRGTISIDFKQKQNQFNIEYSDNGWGITKDVERQIFTAFYSSIKGGGGTGLGMTITRTIIERDFHGSIRLKESIPNQQTIFEIKIKRFDDDK